MLVMCMDFNALLVAIFRMETNTRVNFDYGFKVKDKKRIIPQ